MRIIIVFVFYILFVIKLEGTALR